MPEQSWLPLAHIPEHDALAEMQVPAHSFIPAGQVPPQLVPSQVALPPVGTGQGTQAIPQLATSLLFRQTPTQLCVPDPHTTPPVSLELLSGACPRSTPVSSGRSFPASAAPPVPLASLAASLFAGMSRDRAVVHPVAPPMRATPRIRVRTIPAPIHAHAPRPSMRDY